MSIPPEPLPESIYQAAQVREQDRIAIEQLGVPGYALMCRAGETALAALGRRWPLARRLRIYCGAGNNAGDGYVLARLAAERGFAVHVVAVFDPARLSGDAARAFSDFRDSGGVVALLEEASSLEPDVLVDALLGTGLDRALGGDFAAAVEQINAAPAPAFALDIPTGLHADTGAVLGDAVRADLTITFVALKQGLFLGAAPDYRGTLEFGGLGLPNEVARGMQPVMRRLTEAVLRAALPARLASAHKGSSGRLLLVGGAPGMSGAIRLAGEAALRAGVGLAYVATHPDNVGTVMAGCPELMCQGVADAAAVSALARVSDAVVLGPGLGQDTWGRAMWQAVLATDLPLVLDADGLNLLAAAAAPPARREHLILTPHPGEAARLLGIATADVQPDRAAVARELAARYRAVAVLKGAGSLVASTAALSDGHVADGDGADAAGRGARGPSIGLDVCDRGNPGMATGGMGDVLAGVLGAVLVQCGDATRAARAGVLLHALAGDSAAADEPRGLLPSDLMPHIRRWANPRSA